MMLKPIHFDPDKTSVYMADKASLRILFSLAAANKLLLEHVDLKSAFLHKICCHTMKHPHRICQLSGNLYGTLQGDHISIEGGKEHLKVHKYEQRKTDPCLFIIWHDNRNT